MSTQEARIFARYLLQTEPTDSAIKLYNAAMQANSGDADGSDKKLLSLIVKYPFLLSCVDAGLALLKPNSEVRRRLYVMFSILESTPDYHERFLPKQRSPLFVFVLILVGIRAVFRTAAGIVVVKVAAR